ncbi:MAG: type I DNA topoisomerase [candidate division KSB1 bacterium]|nr:type I DNA topoisomerase [candidate division KSB1 bacterium]MDZ7302462.1 type I DNA topoisomerase [candidate division KSB1 bacterium]MDZ7311944.1 type I DNA topoisomerase [candidate division KSB1 bacterium]
MSKSLVIVESVAKTKTIGKFLGSDFTVKSSVGHIKDLPKQRLGVNIEDGFEPEYITIRGKAKILNDLRKTAAKVDHVYIATDPDREGEAIAFHLAEVISPHNDRIYRVRFNEITERAVKQALAHTDKIDENLVVAQKARRVVDRLVGYQVSPILWRTIYRGLSAGRVQSVALRLICEREEQIDAFIPEEYWSIAVELKGKRTDSFLAKLIKIDEQKPEIHNEAEAQALSQELRQQSFKVIDIKKKEVNRQPPPPFTTSTMQQEAANRLGFTAKRIMAIAQQLYEGVELGEEGSVGLITYMRTDSTRVADEAIAEVRDYIVTDYGLEYLPQSPRLYKAKAAAQDAHEAIRPTSTRRTPKSLKKNLTEDQYKLYELIWRRFVASQMEAAVLEQTSIDIAAGRFLLRTSGSVVIFRGFLQVYEDVKEEDQNGNGENGVVPQNLHVNEVLTLLDVYPKQHFTKPPARYTEASLVKELDALGIGRPSTYALIISTLLARKYVDKQGRQLTPTDLGKTVNKILIQNFPQIFNVTFTAFMEEELDKVEAGEKPFLQVVREFYEPFNSAVAATEEKRDAIKDALQEPTAEACPKCGRPLVIRWGRNGRFMACSGYPECRHTQPLDAEEKIAGEVCENCGRDMVVKIGRYGRFLACSGYPECKTTRPYPIGMACPLEGCNGKIIERRSKSGRTFYGCSNYPVCSFVTWNKPVATPCSQCGSSYLEERYTQADGAHLRCPKCKVKFEQTADALYEPADLE